MGVRVPKQKMNLTKISNSLSWVQVAGKYVAVHVPEISGPSPCRRPDRITLQV